MLKNLALVPVQRQRIAWRGLLSTFAAAPPLPAPPAPPGGHRVDGVARMGNQKSMVPHLQERAILAQFWRNSAQLF